MGFFISHDSIESCQRDTDNLFAKMLEHQMKKTACPDCDFYMDPITGCHCTKAEKRIRERDAKQELLNRLERIEQQLQKVGIE